MSELEPTRPSETASGYNEIVVDTAHFGQKKMILEKDVPVTVRDGTTLLANVFRPPEEGEYPVVMCADLYGKDRLNADTLFRIPTSGGISHSNFCGWEAPDPGYWVPHNYVLVKAGFRGTSGSEGETASPISQQEAEDYYDLIEWAAETEWSNGRVGTNGVSYLAMAQWGVAQLNPPHLEAMIPWEGVSDLYREWSFHGGIPETNFSRAWIEAQQNDWPRDIENLVAAQAEHPLYDDYWKEKHGDLSEIEVPMYTGTSWGTHGLHNRGTLEGFKQASSDHKWLEVHGRKEWEYYYQRETLERQKRFFDYFLKGVENDWLETPRVRLEVRDRFYEGQFRFEDEWPPSSTQETPLYLDAEEGSMQLSPVEDPSTVTYDSTAPRASDEGRTVFTVEFDEDTEVTGGMKLALWVSTDEGTDMDLFVGIKKLDRRGEEIHLPDFNHVDGGRVASGWLRVSHRELDENRSTPTQPWLKHERELPIETGEIVPTEIEIWPSSTRFRAGEKLQLIVQGSSIPRSRTEALPPGHGLQPVEHDETVNEGNHILHTGGEYESHLLIPVKESDD